jgi:amino acid adenylation domain-containing protein/non-ribosomal peptide synthase protein (TIGR01720 family)
MDPSDLFQLIATDLADPARLTELIESAAPRAARPEGAAPRVAPRTPLEGTLTELWSRLLGVEEVGVEDDFFRLGGHSLLGTQMLSRVAAATGVELPLRVLFEAPTPAALALRIAAGEGAAPAPAAIPRGRGAGGGDLPLSPSQQRLWVHQQLAPGDPSYTIPVALRLAGPLDAEALERALAEVARRHEVLRTTYAEVEGSPVQRVGPPPADVLSRADLSGFADGEASLRAAIDEEVRRPFDLATGPVFRARLWRLGPEEHRLLFAVHHIAFDGWSIGVLLREVAALYGAFSRGEPSPLPEPPVQYADHALRQRRWLEGEGAREQLAWWLDRLGGEAPEALELPADRPRPAVRSPRGERLRHGLSTALSAHLHRLGESEGATLFMVLLAGFQALLHRCTGRDDLWTGTPVANRNYLEIEGLIGFFVNTLVLRTNLGGDLSFRGLLARVRETTLGAYDHQDLPFDRLVEELRPERSLGYQPLFQVLFVLQNAPRPAVSPSGLTLEALAAGTGTSRFDLVLSMEEGEAGLAAVWEYSSDLFDPATVLRMASHLETLLASAAADPDLPLSRLGLLTPAERHQTLAEWNDRQADYPRGALVHELLEARAARDPGAAALVMAGETLTYGELNRRANRLAHHLRDLGAGPEARVALLLERSFDMVAALFGVLKSGAAYVPLDPAYPAERLAFILADSRPVALVTRARLIGPVPLPPGPRRVDLDAGAPSLAAASDRDPARAADPANLAYAIYTSGSTGEPKGVMVHHRGLVSLARMLAWMYGVGPGTRVLQLFSFGFDASMWDLLMALPAGGTLCVAPEEARMGGLPLERLLREQRVEVMSLPPSLLAVLPAAELPGVRTVTVTGEACSSEVAAAWAPGRRFFNGYGPTETTVGATIGRYQAGERVPSIGRPFDNTRVHLLDRWLEPVPAIVPGEVYVGGDGLARGYLGQPGLTALRFVPDPLAGEPGERLYRTGDLARFLPDGRLEFLGRADLQVKIRGFRVEPEEIEARLARHPEVAEAVVVARRETGAPLRLVAWIVPRSQPATMAPDAGRLRAFLRESLPDYMVPAVFALVPALPRLPGGKIDRRLLSRTMPVESRADAADAAPGSPAGELLAKVWAEVLRVERVGAHDNFFELGGDSILAIQVVARARKAGLLLTPRQIFEHQTVEELAAAAGLAAADVETGPVSGPVPATPIQRWFFEQDPPAPQHWNQSVLLELRRPLDPARLRAAFAALYEHHDALRLRASRGGAGWTLWNAPPEPAPWTSVDLSALPPDTWRPALEAAAVRVQAGLDLAAGPIARCVLFTPPAGERSRLLTVVHHLAVDGVSWRVLLGDLDAVHSRLEHGEAPDLPPRGTSFRRWAERLAAHAGTPGPLAELSFWSAEERRGVRPLPVDFPGGANPESSARHHRASFSAAETGALLRDLPRDAGARPEEALLAALVEAFAAWTGERRLLLDVEGHGREDLFEGVDLSRTVGWFTAMHPLLLEAAGASAGDSAGETLARIRERLRAVPGRGLGYGLLRYLAGGEPSAWLATMPRAEVSFNYLGSFDATLPEGSPFALAAESAGPPRDSAAPRSHRIDVNASITGGRLHVTWTYGRDLHRPATIEALAGRFANTLRHLLDPGRRVRKEGPIPEDFPLARLTREELDALVEDLVDPEEEPA